MEYRDLNVRVNSADDASISYKNFVNFGPVTPEKTGSFVYFFTTWQNETVLPSGDRAKNARSICLPSFWQHYLVAMATSLDKL